MSASQGSPPDGGSDERRVSMGPEHTESRSSVLSPPKVRFSLDAPTTGRLTIDTSRGALRTSGEASSSTAPADVLSPRSALSGVTSPPLQSPSSSLAPSRSRNRGYSLRRSLFAQNLERQAPEHGIVIEMDSPTASPSSPTLSHSLRNHEPKSDKGSPTVVAQEEIVLEDELPDRSIRLSDPKFDLPSYTRWLNRQRSGPAQRLKNLKQALDGIRKRLLEPKVLPPTVNGRHVRINLDKAFLAIDERTETPYITNIIRSCRYTPLNFVPRQLWAQFGKLANFYFLCVSLLQMVPGLSTTGTYTTIIPLLIFVCISMAKEAYDDLRRNRLDKEENERSIQVLGSQQFHSALSTDRKSIRSDSTASLVHDAWRTEKWQNVRVGDVILLERDAPLPADIILLSSSDPTGIAYIETKSLDGETNLKSKRPLQCVVDNCKSENDAARFHADFVVEDPNLDLYKFEGKVTTDGISMPLSNNEVIYRGSILRNTHHVFGLVIYTGEECKIRMNANKNPRIKAPALQARVNQVVVLVACIVFFVAIVMSILNRVWHVQYEEHAWYLKSAFVPFGHILTSFIIMFNTMLPLSLYVSLEIVKLVQIYFMNDIDMYDPESDTPMEAHTSTINEELGQVSYIFSDKTGTLTNNTMRFRKMSIAGTAWLHDLDVQEALERSQGKKLLHKKRNLTGKNKQKARKSSVSIRPISKRPSFATSEWQPPTKIGASLQCGKTEELLEYIKHRPQTVFARKARFFILGLALCHTCVPEKDEDGNIQFQAESPDELALVNAAQELGYIVSDRQANTMTVKTYPEGEDEPPVYETFEVLDVIEFTSARKRMSIIIRMPDSRICIFSKGADTTIRKLLRMREVAETKAAHVERRASIRKSLEVTEALRRKSMQVGQDNRRTSLGTVPIAPMIGRKSSVSLHNGRTVRESVDAWLTDRETDVDVSKPRKSSTFYAPRVSGPFPGQRPSNVRPSSGSFDNPRSSFQSEDLDIVIDERMVINDNAVFERCFQHIDDFATEGLRTLLYAYRYIPESDYLAWKEKFNEATTSLSDRQEKIEAVGDLIECQLDLLGATAIEDKLQDGVPDAIERFRRAGIKMWMLTGDKRETAINIGHSCRLIKDYSTTIILDHEKGDLPARMSATVADLNHHRTAHSVLVVDGQTLMFIDADPASKALFTDLAVAADSVICCRASPSQKADLVRTIRLKVKGSVTLAIGDGANDIAMIQEAHVGIGIAGKEGLQAARTSDYSIAQFRFLLKLLLVHGRWNYVRVCKYTLGTFWKEMVFYIIQALYQRWTGYTGTSLYEPWSMSMFNTLFTSLPVIFMGVFEKDLASPTLLAVPELYAIGRENQGFNIFRYARWATLGATYSVIIFFSILEIFGHAMFTKDQRIYATGNLAFTVCVVIISLKMQFFDLHNKSITAYAAMTISIGGWALWNILLTLIYPSTSAIYNVKWGLLHRWGKNPLWWITLIVIVTGICMLEVTIKAIKIVTVPTDTEVFQMYERDLPIKKRFEESAATLLQQGWNRGTKKSSLEIAQEEGDESRRAAIEAQREAEIEEILNRPRTMQGPATTTTNQAQTSTTRFVEPNYHVRRRSSANHADVGPFVASPVQMEDEISPVPKRSMDIGELFRSGFGTVRKDSMKL